MSAPTLPVAEIFSTWQGEGCHMGRAAFFIRLYGCSLHCPWCDSAGTWHADYKPENGIKRLTVQELLAAAKESGTPIVVITGGEPGIFDLKELTLALHLAGLKVHVETSGAFELRGYFDWITVSPKFAKLPVANCLLIADEIKIIVDTEDAVDKWHGKLSEVIQKDLSKHVASMGAQVWLHPEWSQRESPIILNAISDAVKARPKTYRAGWQLHKLYRVDALDKRSAPLAPLGGDPSKGY